MFNKCANLNVNCANTVNTIINNEFPLGNVFVSYNNFRGKNVLSIKIGLEQSHKKSHKISQ